MNTTQPYSWRRRAPGGAVALPDDSRVAEALEEYVRLKEAGAEPDRAVFLARHGEIAPELAECLDGIDLVESMAGAYAPASGGERVVEAITPGTRLGDYRVVREVGRGGMGVVYEAEQSPLGRRVALKVLPASASLDPVQRQRFRLEAQAASLLHHDHIVPVFGLGCDRGVYYYAMPFIEGRALDAIIRDLRADREGGPVEGHSAARLFPPPGRASGPSSSARSAHDWPYFRAVAELGLQAALALDHAHGLGVLHRDVKPSNLLLDGQGHLWVADFGLARVLETDLGLTRTGDLVGTLRYMSPEQARGDGENVGPRADVYALGATLYELLTLRPAFAGADRQEVLRRVLFEEPAAPRRVEPSVPRDLETIILKAMDKEPAARYAGARELADDLRNFLDDRPIRARRPNLLERAAKWSRRHRGAVLGTAALLLVALSVAVAGLWEAKRRTERAYASMQEAKEQAEASLKSQRQAAWRARMAFELSHDAIGRINRLLAEKKAAGDRELTEAELGRLCRDAVAYNDRLASLFSADGPVQEVAARSARSSAAFRALLGDPKADDDYRRAARYYEQLAAAHPDFVWLKTGLIETLTEHARHRDAVGDRAGADALLHRALPVAERLVQTGEGDKPCFNMALKGAFNDLAWELVRRPSSDQGDAPRAAALARKAIAWDPAQPGFWNTLGVAYHRSGDGNAAAEALQKACALNNGGDPVDWLALALVREVQGDSARARTWFDRAEDWRRQHPDRAKDPALLAFRAEAARALGVEGGR